MRVLTCEITRALLVCASFVLVIFILSWLEFMQTDYAMIEKDSKDNSLGRFCLKSSKN
jgi:hypothetical protein